MCGRYYIAEEDQAEELKQIIDMVNRKHNGDSDIKTAGEIFPSERVPVIATSRGQKILPFPLEWGYTTSDGNRLINARSETASQKPTFKDGMLRRRCIIPASWYFEWNRNEPGKPKYAIGAKQKDVIYMAGLYRFETDEQTKASKPVFTILTRDPADSIQFIHHRMPVLLPKEAVRDWLNTEQKKYSIAQF
nr:MAG TPA: SOS response associated peptidase (SRAP) [Caudoviricetes sp.]